MDFFTLRTLISTSQRRYMPRVGAHSTSKLPPTAPASLPTAACILASLSVPPCQAPFCPGLIQTSVLRWHFLPVSGTSRFLLASAIQPIHMLTSSSHPLSLSTLALILCLLKTETTHILYIHPFMAYNSVIFSIFRVVQSSLQSVIYFFLDLAK